MGLFSGIASALGIGGVSGGIQSSVNPAQLASAYKNTQTGLQQQQDLLHALQAQNGITNQSNVFNQQQQLANQLGVQAQGGGPNPALQQLQNQTGQNVAQQASLMAGQRGASSNPALIARMAAQQGAGIQQQAVGQEAQLQAQQQLAAQQALQQQQASMAGLATQQVGQQQGAVNAYQQGASNQQGNLLGAQSNYNSALVQNQGSQNQAIGAIIGGVGGGLAESLADGGEVVPHHLAIAASIFHPDNDYQQSEQALLDFENSWLDKNQGGGFYNDMTGQRLSAASGGKVPVMVSPGEKSLSPEESKKVAAGKEDIKSVGKTFKGKASVDGDSYKNDTVKTELEAGGFVIPRSIMQSEDPASAARDFVARKLREKSGDEHGDFHEALKRAISSRGKK